MGKFDSQKQYNGYGKNRAGLQPDQQSKPYTASTSQVKQYMQQKVNALYAAAGKSDAAPQVNIYSIEMSRMFYPFIVVLGTECIKNANEDGDSKIDTFFQTNNDETYVELDEILFNLFKNYCYNKDDQDAFFSDAFRRQLGLGKASSVTLKSLRNPKVVSVNNGRDQVVMFMIDPLRVFHDMLTEEDDKREFYVCIRDTKKINTGEYKYHLKRELKTGKNKAPKGNNIVHELESKIRGQMRK